MKLPLSLLEAIEGYGIKGEDIIFAANGDLDECFRFADSVIAITKDKLIIARYPYIEKKEVHLGGYNSWSLEEAAQAEKPAVLFF